MRIADVVHAVRDIKNRPEPLPPVGIAADLRRRREENRSAVAEQRHAAEALTLSAAEVISELAAAALAVVDGHNGRRSAR